MRPRSGPQGRVRIIGGEWRRRWLPVPAGDAVRPTSDRVRETLFNWLQPWLPGSRCLDLFAGSGVLGFEAVSRGAAHATLVECAPALVAQLDLNVRTVDAAARIRVVESTAGRFLDTPPDLPFDVVFIDPPYASGLVGRVLPRLAAGWLVPAALIYLETARDDPTIALPEGWRMMREGATRHVRYALIRTAGRVREETDTAAPSTT